MRYYIARQQDTLPNVVFDKVADSLEELEAKGLDGSGLVVEEGRLLDSGRPDYISYEYGMCSVRIMNGQLVPADKSAAIVKFAKSVQVAKTRKAEASYKSETFSFDGREFPMTAGAIWFYHSLFLAVPNTPVNIIAVDGNYVLDDNQLEAFKAAFNAKMMSLYAAQGVE